MTETETEIINKFFLEEDRVALTKDDINVDLTHEQSLLVNVELLGLIADIKFYLDNVNLGVVTDRQIISDLKEILGS